MTIILADAFCYKQKTITITNIIVIATSENNVFFQQISNLKKKSNNVVGNIKRMMKKIM